MRFHLDEHVAHAVADGLRRQGIDVTTTVDAELLGEDDGSHLAWAHQEGRVLVTHDEDFTRLHSEGAQHSGICYCHQGKHGIGDLLRMLILVHDCLTAEEMVGHLEYL